MCLIHKGFGGFRALSFASILGGNLISLKTAIPYEIIHLTLHLRKKKNNLKQNLSQFKNIS
jgi:hypothetical protein